MKRMEYMKYEKVIEECENRIKMSKEIDDMMKCFEEEKSKQMV